MRLWNSKRYRKPRPASRVSALFSTPTVYDYGDDHAFSSSSNGYGPQVISDAGFRPNNLAIPPSGNEAVDDRSPNSLSDSSVSERPSTRKGHLEPWSPSTVYGATSTSRSPTKHDLRVLLDNAESSRGGLWRWIPHVAQPADDDTVLYRVKESFLFVEQFVLNFYTDRAAICEVSQEAMARVNRSQLLSNAQLQDHLNEAAYPTALIQHILIALMLDLISFDSVSSQGRLLPKHFQCYVALARARTRSNTNEIPHVQAALSAYRVLSTYLHSSFGDDQTYLDEKQQVSKEVAADFRSAFHPWLDKDKSQEDWEASFNALIEKTAALGTFLFSQPSVFLFNWEMTSEDQSARLIPITPRLLRIFDDGAQFRELSDRMISMKRGKVFESSVSEETQE